MKRLPELNTEILRSKLKLRALMSQRLLTSGILTGSLLLSPGNAFSVRAEIPVQNHTSIADPLDLSLTLSDRLTAVLPPVVGPLLLEQEEKISQIIHNIYGLRATPVLDGNRLNQAYGLIGAEQHLMRYPGDMVANMAPGRGAWGYFAYSQSQLTPDLVEKEKYYVAVQTLYLPDWTTRLSYLRDWYKFRKVVVVNPNNGRTVVAVVADSGPAAWTGKHFGGSPEVMTELRLDVGKQKGPVILFFVDDPNDHIPLGPVEYNLEKPQII